MNDNNLILLIKKLIDLTSKNSLNWEVTDKDDVFQLSFPQYTIRLSLNQSPSSPLEDAYFIKIFNSNGQLVESVNDEDIKEQLPGSFSKLRELHSQARRKSLGVDKAIDDILHELNFIF
jgi:hypothetical protein